MLSLKTARRAALSPAELKAHLATSYPTPLILPHITKDWPACSSWTLRDDLSKLRSRIGEEKGVEFELGPRGRGYMDGRYRRVGMGFGLFLDAFILDKIPSSTPRSQQPVGYLAQYDIPLPAPPTDPARSISTVPPTPGGLTGTDGLAADLPYTPYMTTGPRSEAWRRTLWIGPGGTFTPFHKDPYIGIYTQLVGRKRFHLVPPSAAPHLAMSPRAPHTNTSTIPLSVDTISTTVSADDSAKMSARSAEQEHGSEAAADPDIDHDQDLSDIAPSMLEEYASLLHRAFAGAEACIATLEPGESVLIPEGWYHSAEGLEVGVGVNAWFR